MKWGNFSNNPNKLQYMLLLTPKGISQKLSLTIHFLERKQAEFERLKKDVLLQAEILPVKAAVRLGEGFYKCQLPVRNNEFRKY